LAPGGNLPPAITSGNGNGLEGAKCRIFEANLAKFLAYTYDKLGEEVVRRWFAASLAA
jgi:hypothetical protein